MEVPKAQYEKESKEDEQTFAELNSATRSSQAIRELVQTSYINKLNSSCLPYDKYLINRAKSAFMGKS